MFKWKARRTEEPPAQMPAPPPAAPQDSLFEAQKRLFGRESDLIVVDAGAHFGHTTMQYLDAFPNCRVIALEPASDNHFQAAATLARYRNRVELLRVGLAENDGTAALRLTSHSGAHSLLEVGDMRFYDEPVRILPPEQIKTTTLDRLCLDRGIETLDVLKMDIQGGEMMALRGSRALLARGAIRVIVLEVLFQELYLGTPTFWDLADYFRTYNYALQGIYEMQHYKANPAVLSWADAIFVAPSMRRLS